MLQSPRLGLRAIKLLPALLSDCDLLGIDEIRLLELVGNSTLRAADVQTLPGTVTKFELTTVP